MQAIRFLFSGSCSVLTDLLVYRLLLGADLSAGLAKGIGFVAGVGVGYPLNRWLTFVPNDEQKRRRTSREVGLYLGVYLSSLAVNVGINAAVREVAGTDAILLAFLIATGATTVMNFVLLKWIVFRHSSVASESGL